MTITQFIKIMAIGAVVGAGVLVGAVGCSSPASAGGGGSGGVVQTGSWADSGVVTKGMIHPDDTGFCRIYNKNFSKIKNIYAYYRVSNTKEWSRLAVGIKGDTALLTDYTGMSSLKAGMLYKISGVF